MKRRNRVTVKYVYHRKCATLNCLSAEDIAGLFGWNGGWSFTDEDYNRFHRIYAHLGERRWTYRK